MLALVACYSMDQYVRRGGSKQKLVHVGSGCMLLDGSVRTQGWIQLTAIRELKPSFFLFSHLLSPFLIEVATSMGARAPLDSFRSATDFIAYILMIPWNVGMHIGLSFIHRWSPICLLN